MRRNPKLANGFAVLEDAGTLRFHEMRNRKRLLSIGYQSQAGE
jgi:hypothetical protein